MLGVVRLLRWYCVENRSSDVLQAKKWLEKLRWEMVPMTLFKAHYDRASGNGGQNVNKVNSKCTVTVNGFSSCGWFPEEIRKQMINGKFRYYARAKDALVIQSEETRSREQNRRICVEKLVKEMKKVVYFAEETSEEKRLKWSGIKKKEKEKRLKDKKYRGDKRRSRTMRFEV